MNATRVVRQFGRSLVVSALAIAVIAPALAPLASQAQVFISVGIAPPPLPIYVQPICPGDGYLWNPGYWAYGPEGYYWVPGVWACPRSFATTAPPGYWHWGGSGAR